ncbi:hypothetical protein QJS04_geneDACA011719 [Acorus gramineus]|uniref:Nicalin n=1 Tax=Acorus gramineus TaxID=55184 RepID=A0AAV9BFI1_ACOGR|nr:hypothetical protein QJS04_geneDACA011719 [Acorus gramineus]
MAGGGQGLDSISSAVALILVLFACVELGDAATAVDVYRLIQYDLAGSPFGSRLADLSHHAGSAASAVPGADLSRTALMVPLKDLDLGFLREYITNRKPLGGLVLLLPQKLREKIGIADDDQGDGLMRNMLSEMEQLLVHANIPYPVYFAFENEKINEVLTEVQSNDATGQPATATTGGYKLVVSTPEPKKIVSPAITNIQGWLPGLKGEGDANQLPTIAIVASYDTFGAAPALSVGSDSNGSGVAALLEIARLFSRLYSTPKMRGRYNLLFGLTSGGPYNYNGTLKWLRSFDQRLRESIDYAICLNSIGSWSDELWIHVSKPPENAYIKEIYEGFSTVADELGFKINIKQKKINISNPRVGWEHEQFSRVRVTAATLSELSVAPDFLKSSGGLCDTRSLVDETAVFKSVKLVAESLARHIYGHRGRGIEIFADNSSLAINPFHINSWLDFLSRTPRVAPFLSKTDPFISALKKELSDHTTDVSVQHDVLDGIFTFYDQTKATLNIYQGLDDLISILRRPPSRKSKAA